MQNNLLKSANKTLLCSKSRSIKTIMEENGNLFISCIKLLNEECCLSSNNTCNYIIKTNTQPINSYQVEQNFVWRVSTQLMNRCNNKIISKQRKKNKRLNFNWEVDFFYCLRTKKNNYLHVVNCNFGGFLLSWVPFS